VTRGPYPRPAARAGSAPPASGIVARRRSGLALPRSLGTVTAVLLFLTYLLRALLALAAVTLIVVLAGA